MPNSTPSFNNLLIQRLISDYKLTDEAMLKDIKDHLVQQDSKYSDLIIKCKAACEKEKQRYLLTTSKMDYTRSELENLFVSCVEEVRRDVMRRKVGSPGKSPSTHAGMFTATDRKRVLELLVMSEAALTSLYD